MQHPESDVRTWQTKFVRREVADWRGRADFPAAMGFMHQRLKKGLLLSQLAAYEANSQFSDFYAGLIEHYWQDGRFPDMGSLVLPVDASVARRVADQYLNLDNAMYYYAAPTLSYSQLGGVVFSLCAIPVGLVFARRYWSAREY